MASVIDRRLGVALQRVTLRTLGVWRSPSCPGDSARICGGQPSLGSCRSLSMPSRADTQPFGLAPLAHPAQKVCSSLALTWTGRTGAGVFSGADCQLLSDRARRCHALSPLLSAEAVLREALRRASSSASHSTSTAATRPAAAVATLAEQTLSAAATGGAAVWVLRGDAVLATTEAESSASAQDVRRMMAFATALRPGDVIALAAEAGEWSVQELLAVSAYLPLLHGDKVSAWLRCIQAEGLEAKPSTPEEAPHRSWAQTIFNEYGSHKAKY